MMKVPVLGFGIGDLEVVGGDDVAHQGDAAGSSRTGATLNAITDLLMTKGQSEAVRVLTITRTRRNP